MRADPESMQQLLVAAITGRTDAAERVFTPKTWSTKPDQMPIVLIRYARNDGASLGKGEIQFETIDTVQIVLQVAKLPNAQDDAILAAEAEAWRIQRQIEAAIFQTGKLGGEIEQFPFIRRGIARNSDGQQTIVEIQTELGLKYYQGPEDLGLLFDGETIGQAPFDDLEEVRFDTRQGGLEADDLDAGPRASVITLGVD